MSAQAQRWKPSKYGNRKVHLDGRQFDSHREARRYQALRLEERAGTVRDLECQVTFVCRVEGKLVCRYIADFTYERMIDGQWVGQVEDAKGHQTEAFKLKKKLVEALHPFTIILT